MKVNWCLSRFYSALKSCSIVSDVFFLIHFGEVAAMPDVEPLRFPSREGRPSQQGEKRSDAPANKSTLTLHTLQQAV